MSYSKAKTTKKEYCLILMQDQNDPDIVGMFQGRLGTIDTLVNLYREQRPPSSLNSLNAQIASTGICSANSSLIISAASGIVEAAPLKNCPSHSLSKLVLKQFNSKLRCA